ncbi:hypothetical protein AVEN_50956-1 [Araneus ventricosus]|uniref:Chitin-binding type-4 domain-containing protein n=1 Tax=Araneus ventricosus TaxID=182803 RepID=A0A4Y2R0U9_ARAVE|nr:hypothetical protein AVEN_50956-1 [Araneus ventricosus]
MLRFAVLISLACLGLVNGHGRLEEPPGRSTMWRFGFKTEQNPDDAELFCGGITRKGTINYKRLPSKEEKFQISHKLQTQCYFPFNNTDGGKYGKGVIARTYKSGQTITAITNIVANHFGWMEFKICPEEPGKTATQECLDQHPLQLADGSGTRYNLGSQRGPVKVQLKLPEGFKCDRCVFQWHWKCGNHWGICEDGKGRLGCGPQEYFRGCADIRIE